MPSILGANTLSGGYEVANSVRFNSADSAQMNKTLGTATDVDKYTISMWVKRSRLGHRQMMMRVINPSSTGTYAFLEFQADDKINTNDYDESASIAKTTNAQFRDPNAWMHIVLALDSTQGTASNRSKLYVNGTQITSFGTDSGGSQNQNLMGNTSGKNIYIGGDGGQDTRYCGLYMAEVCFIDGQQLTPTSFGEFDEDSPTIWKPIDVSGLTFGNNGFYLDFEDSSNLGNDANGGTDFSETNLAATDQSTDTCTNNYSTLNPIFNNLANLTFSEGNLNVVAADANYRSVISTIGVSQGKWYAEFKAVSGFNSTDKAVGIYRSDTIFVATTGLGNFTTGFTFSYGATGNVRTNNGNNDTGEATFTDGDIIQVAMDLDNNKLYFGKNNTYINSGDPTTGSTGTGAYSITASTGEDFFFAVASISSGGAALWSCNFGSPSYANSSDASDGNGYGAFEFAPPSGYYALNSKNLAEYG